MMSPLSPGVWRHGVSIGGAPWWAARARSERSPAATDPALLRARAPELRHLGPGFARGGNGPLVGAGSGARVLAGPLRAPAPQLRPDVGSGGHLGLPGGEQADGPTHRRRWASALAAGGHPPGLHRRPTGPERARRESSGGRRIGSGLGIRARGPMAHPG